ncbi:MAG TPA: methylisocitrate lyase [Geobacteraceae bacterium]|nr:methylisocitrate lyase [Geobacteraceae bacterium]
MVANSGAGSRFRQAVREEKPLQVVGTVNAYAAVMAEKVGFRALYLSGAGAANASFGLPDLGMTTPGDVLEDVRRITGASSLPLLVDIDTGFGGALMIGRTVREMCRAGAAGVHIEDQVAEKRCGHRPGKRVVGAEEMADRIKAAVDGRTNRDFVIMARTDAVAAEGLEAALGRACRYRDAGADMLFPEALGSLDQYRRFAETVGIPVLANMTEFGVTPLYTVRELAGAKVSLVLYPLSAFRAMSAAALKVFRTIRDEGTQKALLDSMQSREELYDFLDYLNFERKLDSFFAKEEKS